MASNIGFFGMLHSVYNAVGVLASAVGKFAQAADNLGTWADEQTGTFVDEARIERKKKSVQLMAELAALENAAPAAAVAQITDAGKVSKAAA